ncbi:hypothetical protein JI721_01925 [Alicyclobacillus cycloheptanicus]|jgi:hypothetical protein|uniref:Uncharacterized protein n=1 Tax=Alicyclobacillus cycloheptanicus TaxID=1457 RepID=A0ABT9XFF3_9BACL|nr:hypothetical protein [Alicyclobacillus cycloheptanicus]MDQ0189023.1 hypothetical protein [Alicyclobacillus cycloheptanicus]WDM01639.1 hypothetical protein JI721_01925 [Alicyclobacillus cycloheptanicus]
MSEMTLLAHELEAHLRLMIEKEKRSGDFLLASVIQDCLVYNLHGHVGHAELDHMSRYASELAVKVALQSLHRDPATIRETTRGVMHALTNLGVNPMVAAISVTFGTVQCLGPSLTPLDTAAVIRGVAQAADELGVGDEPCRVSEHLAWCMSGPGMYTMDPDEPVAG